MTIMASHRQVEYLNCLMLLLSIGVACILPFDTFLFSYAVLGPFHYLTELHWLKRKIFFLSKVDVSLFLGLSVIVTAVLFLNYINGFSMNMERMVGIILLAFFIFCIYLLFTLKSKITKLILSFLILSVGILYVAKPGLIILLGLFLPTLIHVYIFTAFFMMMGYFRSPDKIGLISIVLLLLMPFLIYFLPLENLALARTESEKLYHSTGFKMINEWLVFILGKNEIKNSAFVLKTQIFIAFAYTYHYLNWFSKTSVIGWARSLELKKMILVSGIWILSIALYLYNYQTGLMVLFILSMIHVLAEFPLNALSIKTVFQKLINR